MPTDDPLDPLDPYGAVAALADIPADLIELHRIPPRLWEETLAPLPASSVTGSPTRSRTSG
jgi:hypothetical protein